MKKEFTIEQRELYCYTTGTNPFCDRVSKLSIDMACMAMAARQIVNAAIDQYGKDYGTTGTKIFTHDDFKVVSDRIIEEHKNIDCNGRIIKNRR